MLKIHTPDTIKVILYKKQAQSDKIMTYIIAASTQLSHIAETEFKKA